MPAIVGNVSKQELLTSFSNLLISGPFTRYVETEKFGLTLTPAHFFSYFVVGRILMLHVYGRTK